MRLQDMRAIGRYESAVEKDQFTVHGVLLLVFEAVVPYLYL